MQYSTFNTTANNQLDEPAFFGQSVNLSRFDQQKYEFIEKLTETQLSFFWRPEEIDVSKDRIDYQNLPEHEKHIFVSNLKYQILLDSVQGRSPNAVLLPLVSIPELETWIEIWAAYEGAIHARSYTHIVRNIVNDPSEIFDTIMENEEILARANDISKYYDELHEYGLVYSLCGWGTHQVNDKTYVIEHRDMLKRLYLCLVSINVLEAIRFYVSFVCSWGFAERKLMEGNAKIIKLIARDEALHMNFTASMINLINSGKEGDLFAEVAKECEEEAIGIFKQAAEQEKDWCDYLFKDGSMIGLNRDILKSYVEYITNIRMTQVGLPSIYPNAKSNPVPWVTNWTSSDNVQVAPQETEISSYLVGQVDTDLSNESFEDFEL